MGAVLCLKVQCVISLTAVRRGMRLIVYICLLLCFETAGCGGDGRDASVCSCINNYCVLNPTACLTGNIKGILCACYDCQGMYLGGGGCLPLSLGIDPVTGRGLEVAYECSCICPHSGSLFVRYKGVEGASECSALGGRPAGPQGWVGCIPPGGAMCGYLETCDY